MSFARWIAQGLDHLLPLSDTIRSLEFRMSLTDQALSELDDATNEIAAELEALEGELSGLDSSVADRVSAAAARLRGLAADPENPVPADPGTGDAPADPSA